MYLSVAAGTNPGRNGALAAVNAMSEKIHFWAIFESERHAGERAV